jgi:CubicO group peptidase (beta-lactamase class C family)
MVVAAATTLHARPSLEAMLEAHRTRHGLPALAAAVAVEGKVVAVAAVGTRRAGARIPVRLDDRFHLGSDTKAMTALLAGMAVEAGTLRWSSTMAEVFPDLADQMAAGLAGVTLEQLLSHTSGVPGDNEAFLALLQQSLAAEGNLDEMRRWLVRQWVKQPLASRPGTVFAYANMNYVIAGAMLERVSGRMWEELITERVFQPLGLRTAGLGPQASLGRIDAPLGHAVNNGQVKAFLAGPNGDNPPIIGPAGTAHMSVLDFVRWAAWNAGEGRRGPALVRPATLRRLHTPVVTVPTRASGGTGTPIRGGYGLGWGKVTVDWAPEPLLQHAGSNGMNLAHIWLDPRRDFAMVVVTNIGGDQADAALLAVAQELYGRFAGGKPVRGRLPVSVPQQIRGSSSPLSGTSTRSLP